MTERSELAEFLRARREQVRPADVGLPTSGRRRTPGLRREEVATLAGVSIDYLVRLEQGRDVHPSVEVLHAIGEALRLDEDEMLHLKRLGMISGKRAMCPTAPPLVGDVPATVVTMLQALDPMPAFVIGAADHVLAWNAAWASLVAPLGLLGDDQPNLARYVFLDERARHVYPDWDAAADQQVGRLRAAAVCWPDDPAFVALIDELRRAPEFERRWVAHPVGEKRRGVKELVHPDLGRLRLAFEVLALSEAEQQLITWLPADDATAAALRGAVPVSPARLRVVGGA